ncbi:MAG TPA: FAD-dependent oxidoreductase, partial [Aquificae bacterium]|nr:FAD-dependent oxidoreductase [Aquificota bacterium]
MITLDEKIISQAIIDSYFEKLKNALDCDIAIVGGGPTGLTAAYYLSKQGFKVVLLEKKISVGGGMWAG